MRKLLVFLAIAGLVALASCGGGGGGGDGPPPPVCGTGTASVTISGTAQFESVPINSSNGALNYAGITPRPIRGAVVEILCGFTVMATTETNESGQYSAAIAPSTPITVRVKAQLLRPGAPAWNFRVLDNTNSSALYVLDSAPVSGNASTTVNLVAGSGWNGSSYATTRASGPFAILNTVYEALQKTLTAAPAQVWPALDIYWSANNRPGSSCGFTQGCIGTTSFGSVSGAPSMFVLGLANLDTDEFDSHVVAHEFGHYLQDAVSRDDSTGGSHGSADRLDMRIAFSEGWGNAWSGIALNDPIYRDSSGASQSQGFTLDVSASPSAPLGWYREMSVAKVVWDVNQQLGFTPLWNALTGPVRTTDGAVTSAHLLGDALKQVAPAQAGTIEAIFAGQSINVTLPLGAAETNNGGLPIVIPVYKTVTVGGAPVQLCVDSMFGTFNKLGNYAYARVNVASAGDRSLTLTGPGGTDPDLQIWNNGFVTISQAAGNESFTVNLATGTYVIVVYEFAHIDGVATAPQCFTLTIS
jgi:hypothetical protein